MPEKLLPAAALCWIVVVSLAAAALTVYDKRAAKRSPRRRVRERTLLALGALGGAAAEYAVMRRIRHKTLHKKFMVGLPVMIVLHVLLLIFLVWRFVPWN